MDEERTLRTLRERLAREEAASEALRQEEEKYVRLPRKRYFSIARRKSESTRRIAALKTAIQLFERPFGKVDVHEGCLMGLSSLREDWAEILVKAGHYALHKRAEAAKVLFETSLPAARKQVLAKLSRWAENP